MKIRAGCSSGEVHCGYDQRANVKKKCNLHISVQDEG